jgi:signal transduction histidine kinase
VQRGLLLGIVAAIVMLAILGGGLLSSVHQWFSDLLYAPAPLSGKIVIVAIDDLSLASYGRSVAEWNRGLHADLVDLLAKDGARVVVFDVIFSEASQSPADDRFAQAITDAQIKGTRTVLAASEGTLHSEGAAGMLHSDGLLFPYAPFQSAAAMIGHTGATPDTDNYVRQLPLQISGSGGQPVLALSAAAYLSYFRIPANAVSQVVKAGDGVLTFPPRIAIPVDSFERMTLNYFGPPGTFPAYSYRDVHDGKLDPAIFKDKIVLVGAYNASGITDRYLVPIDHNALMSGVEIHANSIETLLQNRPLTEQNTFSIAAMILIAAVLSGPLFMRIRWYWGFLGYAVAVVLIFLAASLIFSVQRQIIAISYPILTLTLTRIGTLGLGLQYEFDRRRTVQNVLDGVTRIDEQRLVLDDILQSLNADIMRFTGVSRAAIALYDEAATQLTIAYPIHTVDPEWLSDASAALTSMKPILRASHALVPMSFQGRPLGVIAALGSLSRDRDLLLRTFAGYAAPAIANSRMYTNQLHQNELLSAILASSPDPILVLDSAQQVIRVNQTAQRLFMLSDDDLPNVEDLFPDGPHIYQALGGNIPFRLETKIGAQHFLLSGGPLRDVGWVLNLNDVTSLKDLDALKTQMIRMASHDLKNPLSVIMGYTEFMLGGQLKAEPRNLETINRSAKQMLGIITDLLNLEKLRSGALELSPLSFNPFIRQLVAEYEQQAKDKNQTLTLREPPTELTVQAETRQLHEAIGNLISNAIKYTPAGGSIHVEVSLGTNRVQIAVKDTGYGIPKEAQQKLFQPFYRVKTRDTAEIPGTGLGLSLVKAVIDSHHGRLWVESEEGKGSTFFVELPMTS